MKLYLSSYRIPCPDDLFALCAKPVEKISVAVIPNAKDYYAQRAQTYKIDEIRAYQAEKGLKRTTVIDLRDFRDQRILYKALSQFDVIWAVGGNTFCLRQEMRRSGFEKIIHKLLHAGIVYGGDSAGAVVAGASLRGIESADIPEFTEEPIYDGLSLIPEVIIPHVDNAYFSEANEQTRTLFPAEDTIELNDNQAMIIHGKERYIVSADTAEIGYK